MNKNRNKETSNKPLWFFRVHIVLFGLSFMVLFSPGLSAQSDSNTEGYDYDGRAIVSVLPFIGEEEAAERFNQAVADALVPLQKYSSRMVNAGEVGAAGFRIPTDMPPIRDLVPGARYALTGGVYPGNTEIDYYLQLWLWDMGNSTMIYTDDLVYQDIDEGLASLPGLVEWLFSHITETVVESEIVPEAVWEDKRLNVGIRSGISQRWYDSDARALVYEGGVFASVFLNSLFSIQAEIDFSYDHLVYRGITDDTVPVYANEKRGTYSLMFPLILKANFRPGNFRLAPFAGIYGFLPLGDASYRINPEGKTDSFSWSVSAPVGFTLGFEAAVKCGPGILLADIRYASDFGVTTIHDNDDAGTGYKGHYDRDPSYQRKILTLTLGYAFGFIDLKK